ncbi:MAG: tetraacyldisaccharide 4'-kinase, partial [Gammaproteobacteria bacterium]
MQSPSWWRSRNIISWLLWPFSLLFGIIVFVRRQAYRMDIFRVYRPKLSVIVVGNINVGGTGKTPLVIALARQLQQLGMRPAIISRGYKSKAKQFPFVVTADTPVVLAGDEPLMMARHTHCMVMIDPCRVRAVKALEATGEYDVIISDDGLQHYALARDLEIVVVDNKQQFGNDFLLPAGMLREPVSRIENADIVVCNYEMHEDHKIQHQLLAVLEKNNRYFKMHLKPTSVKSLTTDEA